MEEFQITEKIGADGKGAGMKSKMGKTTDFGSYHKIKDIIYDTILKDEIDLAYVKSFV